MKKEELEEIISSIEKQSPAEQAGFGFFHSRDEEFIIRGNKIGLQLFASELLKAANRVDDLKNGKVDKLKLNINHDWVQNEFSIRYIEPVLEFKKTEPIFYKENFKDKISKYGCIFFVVILVSIFVIGVISVWNWF